SDPGTRRCRQRPRGRCAIRSDQESAADDLRHECVARLKTSTEPVDSDAGGESMRALGRCLVFASVILGTGAGRADGAELRKVDVEILAQAGVGAHPWQATVSPEGAHVYVVAALHDD